MHFLSHRALLPILCYLSWASAWPWIWPQSAAELRHHLDRRQDSGPTPTATQAAPTSTAASSGGRTSTASTTSGSTSSSLSGSSGASTTSGSGTVSTRSGSSTRSASGMTTFDPRLPAGGVQMLVPAPISGQQYYKVGETVTFAWNYTSISVLPTAVDVLATCTQNSALYTLAVNQTVIQGPGGKSNGTASNGTSGDSSRETATWDTGAYAATATVGLPNAVYTLIIYDASKPSSAIASPGYLATYQQYTFGLYNPQSYNNGTGYNCVTCSKAAAAIEKGFLRGIISVGLAFSLGGMVILGRL